MDVNTLLPAMSLVVLYACRASGGRILEALHVDPASAMSLEQEKNAKMLRPPIR